MKQIGPYRLLALIAEGGMAGVYLAEKEEAAGLKRRVAVKRIKPELASDPQFTERFIAEARISLDLQHPNLIRVYGFEKIAGELLLVMEHIDGCDLGACKNRIMPAAAFRSLAAQTTDALAALHAIGIAHRDVSPSNILIDRKGVVKLSDFGIAAALAEGAGPQDFGQCRYLSPAVLDGKPAGPQDDLYSLALALAECAGGGGIDNSAGQPDLKTLASTMRRNGMEREAALLLRAAGISGDKIEAHEFAAAMRGIAAENRDALANFVNTGCNKKADSDFTLPLTDQADCGKKPAARNGTLKRLVKLAMILAAAGFIVAQILTAILLRGNDESQQTQNALPENPQPQQLVPDYALLPLDAKPKASVIIDGVEQGLTPLKIKVAPGMHEINFIWPESEGWKNKVSHRAYLQSGPNKEIFVSRKKAEEK